MRDRASALAPLLPLLLLALAGCAGSDAPAADEADGGDGLPMEHGAHGSADAGTHLLVPEWAVGDFWTMSSPQGGTFTYAVSADAGADWVMDTDNLDNAFFDARGDISFLGKVRKLDLAGSQGTTRVEFL